MPCSYTIQWAHGARTATSQHVLQQHHGIHGWVQGHCPPRVQVCCGRSGCCRRSHCCHREVRFPVGPTVGTWSTIVAFFPPMFVRTGLTLLCSCGTSSHTVGFYVWTCSFFDPQLNQLYDDVFAGARCGVDVWCLLQDSPTGRKLLGMCHMFTICPVNYLTFVVAFQAYSNSVQTLQHKT